MRRVGSARKRRAHPFARYESLAIQMVAIISITVTSCTSPKSVNPSTRAAGAAAIGVGSDEDLAQAALVELNNSFARVGTCMRVKGFKFMRPVKPDTPFTPDASQLGEWRLTHGYGMADDLERRRSEPSKAEDPNQLYRSGLSTSDQTAYDRAVGGRDGCFSQGMSGDPSMGVVRTRLAVAREEMESRIAFDPRVVRSESEWSSCMQKGGYSVFHRRDIFEKLLLPHQQRAWAAAGGDGVRPTVPEPEIQALRAVELQVAKADVGCSSKQDMQLLKEVREEYEAKFINENSAVLERIGQSLSD